jgi:hypothetical protein
VNALNEIAKAAKECLETASRFGQVIIVTNSDDGWVKYSAERFFPSLVPFLDQVEIVSARSKYERFYPNQPLCWKAACFASVVNEKFGGGPGSDVLGLGSKEVISFGDSLEERTAVKIVSAQFKAVSKSVKFMASPSPLQILGQLTMLTTHMQFVCDATSELDLEISADQANRSARDHFMNNNNNSARSKGAGGEDLPSCGAGVNTSTGSGVGAVPMLDSSALAPRRMRMNSADYVTAGGSGRDRSE